jgi:putative sugar O-methyltransferase
MSHKPDQSPLWAHINQTQITKETTMDLTNFKSNGVNFKIALWDPQVNGARYLKALIYNLCANLSSDNWSRLRQVRNREVGNPVAVKYNGELVCMDYLQAVFEMEFLTKNINLGGLSILEIGAGYGRTCHTVISNHDVVAYYIIDLENSLDVAKRYLSVVLDKDQFSKIHFIMVDDVDKLVSVTHFDLCINIDSFAEMKAETVKYYFDLVDAQCRYFYVKNPVGKYLDKSLDAHSQGNEVVELALKTGVLRDIVDIYDSQAIEAQAPKFISAYQPSEKWKCIANEWAIPWSYYWQALYRKEGKEE